MLSPPGNLADRLHGLLYRLPAPLHRTALRLAHALRRCWWMAARPQIQGCRVIALDAAGRVMLVRHAYGSNRWMPPGGGVKPGEDPVLAGAREFEEEIGCRLEGARLLTSTLRNLHGAGDLVHVVIGTSQGAPRPDLRELTEAAWFALDALPRDISPALAERLPEWARAWSAP